MKTLRLAATCLLLCSLPAERASAESAALPDPVEAYITLAIQGDLSGFPEWFSQYPPDRYPERLELEQTFLDRFSPEYGQAPADAPGLPERIADAYRIYWKEALLDPRQAGEHERVLLSGLATLLDRNPAAATVRNILETVLAPEGVHVFEGSTPPLRDLFLWRQQESRKFDVQLTERSVEVTVHFMDEFLVQGWKDFASLGLATTTGWVEDGELYCLAWAYDTGSENFAVSYLQHEARHLVDLESYPGLDATELEYRAKLTELAFANRTLSRILEDFTDKAVENPNSPHAMANWRVVRDLYWHIHGAEMPASFDSWRGVRVGQVNRAARILLDTSNERMKKGQ